MSNPVLISDSFERAAYDLEYCMVCGEPTGRAGRGDDSIYCTASQVICLSPDGEGATIDAGDEVGPLCVGCYEKLRDVGFIETD